MKIKPIETKLIGILIGFLFICSSVIVAEPIGWRTDGTGKYPDAVSPTEWSAEKNVIWKTKMPDWSNSIPVVVDDRIFVTSEPTTLVCVDASNGEILWQRTNTYLDTVPPEERDEVKQQLKELDIENTTKEFRSVEDKLNKLNNQLKKAEKKLEESPDDGKLKQKIKDYEQEIEKVSREIERLEKKLEPVEKFVIPRKHKVNGYSSSTPVSDGQYVYVLFGTGVVSCYDMKGNRKWIKFFEKPTQGHGHSSSPVLVNDKLIVHIKNLIALDRETGEVIWKKKAKERWGTAFPTNIGGVDVIITPNGDIFRVSDGKLFAQNISSLDYASPIVHNDVVYFIQHGGKAFRLPSKVTEEKTKPEFLWETKPNKDRYYASPIYHEGLLYAVTRKGRFSVIDANTGEVIYKDRLRLGKGDVFPSITFAGDYLFLSSESGTTLVLEPGREPKQLEKNKLEQFRSSPVFIGKRMYIRGLEHLYCIGD